MADEVKKAKRQLAAFLFGMSLLMITLYAFGIYYATLRIVLFYAFIVFGALEIFNMSRAIRKGEGTHHHWIMIMKDAVAIPIIGGTLLLDKYQLEVNYILLILLVGEFFYNIYAVSTGKRKLL